jgi:hypothetical protein
MIEKITREIIDKILHEFNREHNKEKIYNLIIEPFIYLILDKMYPYIFITATVFILILLLLVVIITIMLKKM